MENKRLKDYSRLSHSTQEREEKVGYQVDQQLFALSYLRLRKIIGYLGIGLPIICLMGSLFHDFRILPSISHYYHSSARVFFTSILVLLATFLFTYRSQDRIEQGICKALAILAILIVMFPTRNSICTIKDCYTNADLDLFVAPSPQGQLWTGALHLLFAFIFFALLIYLIFGKFLVEEKKQDPDDRKSIMLYQVCGWTMVLSLFGILITTLFFKGSEDWMLPPTFCFESLALASFGVSWLTKGETFSDPG